MNDKTSNSFELGFRGTFDQFQFGITGFYNTYNNFIATFQPAGTSCLVSVTPCPAGGPTGTQVINLFQSQNISNARIFGLEVGGEYQFSPDNGGFSLLGSLAWSQGDDLTSNVPLNTVDPFKAVLGLRYQDPSAKWRAEFIGTFVGTARVASGTTNFVPDAYTVFDLVGGYQIIPNLGLNLGIYNLFNNRYFNYSDVRALPANAVDIDRYSQPGTNVRLGVNLSI